MTLEFDPGATAELTVSNGALVDLELVVPLDASGMTIAGVSPSELRFSEQELRMVGSVVPEPSTALLVAQGVVLLALRRRAGRRDRSAPW